MEIAMLGTAEIAKMTGMSQRQIQRLVRQEAIPGREIKRGQTWIKFDAAKVKGWIASHQIPFEQRGKRGRKSKRDARPIEDMLTAATRRLNDCGVDTVCRALKLLSEAIPRRIHRIAGRLTADNVVKLHKALHALSLASDQSKQMLGERTKASKRRKSTLIPDNS